jgi:hypothetical protein
VQAESPEPVTHRAPHQPDAPHLTLRSLLEAAGGPEVAGRMAAQVVAELPARLELDTALALLSSLLAPQTGLSASAFGRVVFADIGSAEEAARALCHMFHRRVALTAAGAEEELASAADVVSLLVEVITETHPPHTRDPLRRFALANSHRGRDPLEAVLRFAALTDMLPSVHLHAAAVGARASAHIADGYDTPPNGLPSD